MRHGSMKPSINLPATVLAILLTVCLFTYYATRDSARPVAPQQKSAAAAQPLVDTSLLQTALKLAPMAVTPDEQGQAHEAWRLADHELDLTSAAALPALPATGSLRQLSDRIANLKGRVAADKKQVEELGKDAGDALDLALPSSSRPRPR